MQSLAPAPTSNDASRTPTQMDDTQEGVNEQILREQLLSQVTTSDPSRDQNEMPASSPASPNETNAVDPTIAGAGLMSASAGSDDGNENDGRKGYGRRELSTSKRAAQNRAAQRAFRQRKEGYIKKLEEQVRDYSLLSENFKALQNENYQLRDYIINLQSRLIESQGDFPQPPPDIVGLHPANAGEQHQLPARHVPAGAQPSLASLNQVREAVAAGHGPNFNGQTSESGPYPSSDGPAAKRVKAESEMQNAQQVLAARVER